MEPKKKAASSAVFEIK